MRSIIWLVLICLIGLGAVVAIKIGARTPEGADVDKAKVGAATEQGTPIRAKNSWVCDIVVPISASRSSPPTIARESGLPRDIAVLADAHAASGAWLSLFAIDPPSPGPLLPARAPT